VCGVVCVCACVQYYLYKMYVVYMNFVCCVSVMFVWMCVVCVWMCVALCMCVHACVCVCMCVYLPVCKGCAQ